MKSPLQKIMVHIDGTEQSITAAQYAICLAKALNAELTAVYVINTRALNDLVKSHIFLETEQDEYQRDIVKSKRKDDFNRAHPDSYPQLFFSKHTKKAGITVSKKNQYELRRDTKKNTYQVC